MRDKMSSKDIKIRVKELLATSNVSQVKVKKSKGYVQVYVLKKLAGIYDFAQFRYHNNQLLSVKGELMFHEIMAMNSLFNY